MQGGFQALAKAKQKYPNCTIANCTCDSKHGKWLPGCHCLCHFKQMNEIHGHDNWTLQHFNQQAKRGITE